jgi:hypothetical protein
LRTIRGCESQAAGLCSDSHERSGPPEGEVSNGPLATKGWSAIYAVCDLVDARTGEPLETVTCGGRNVLAGLVKMIQEGWQDRAFKLTAKKTGEGYQVLWLEAA